MFERKVFAACLCALLAIPSVGALQDTGASAKAKVDVSIALKVAGKPYNFTGKARCTHAPKASFYEMNAKRWRVEHDEDQASVLLTLWRPVDGSADMFTVHCSIGDKRYAVSTLKASGGGDIQGSGTVTFAAAESGGTFTIDAKAVNGASITGTIKCSAFLPEIAEGG